MMNLTFLGICYSDYPLCWLANFTIYTVNIMYSVKMIHAKKKLPTNIPEPNVAFLNWYIAKNIA